MTFFTPDLYCRYNAADDAEADLADEEWERALRAYREYLAKHSPDMSARVKEVAGNLSLHDAEFLAIQEDAVSAYRHPPQFDPFSIATISVREGVTITNLIYFLTSPIEVTSPEPDWPFSQHCTHWLYDEIHVETNELNAVSYWHNILWSDGRVTSIPFLDVIVQSYSIQNPEAAVIAKKRA